MKYFFVITFAGVLVASVMGQQSSNFVPDRNRNRQFLSPGLESVAPVDSGTGSNSIYSGFAGFSCSDKYPGFYADVYTNCQMYHVCLPDGRRYSSLCGTGTIFNQRTLVCDHWYNYDCNKAVNDYETNQILKPFRP